MNLGAVIGFVMGIGILLTAAIMDLRLQVVWVLSGTELA